MNQSNPFGNPHKSPGDFSGLDDAQAFGPELGPGTTWYEIHKCDSYDAGFGLVFVAEVKVEASDNPDNVPEKIYRLKRSGLTKNQYQESNMAKLKAWLATLLGVDPSMPPSPGETWADLANQAVATKEEAQENGWTVPMVDGGTLRGVKGKVYGEETVSKNGNSFVKWKYLPYSDPNAVS